ncbi:ABC transporter substrate-binding protein [Paenibacillus paridis]|uniref:ABC transporter substrate-binding protein n=1 Tax=Paenibacillus paridis TaxID=2583376 RepID=UPI00111F39D1|nr:ABC transporter substrate-binding protein [Paenibacillus paridis]
MHQRKSSSSSNQGFKWGRKRYRTIAGLMVTVIMAVLISACGNNTNSVQTDSPAQSTAQPEEQKPLTIKHDYGETIIPTHPQRIAVIGLEDLALSLEVPMVYAYGFDGYYLEDQLNELNIPLSGSADTNQNLEQILETKPDLILLQQYFTDQAGYDELSKIAPTVPYKPDNWKATITDIGKILGLEKKSESVIQAYDDKIKEAKKAVSTAAGTDNSVVFIRPSIKDLQVFFPSFNPLVYEQLGLKPDASIEAFQKESTEDWGMNTSLEKLPSITANYVFAIYGGSIDTAEDFAKEEASSAEVEKLTVWKTIPAVKQNHVFKVSARHWMSSGPIAEGKVIDDVVAAVTNK